MTDGQLAALLSTLTAIAGGLVTFLRWAVRWGVERLTKALDDNTASNRELSKAQLEHASSMATLSAKIDAVTDWVHDHTPVPVEPPSTESERRRITRDRMPVPEPLPETTPSQPYRITRKR